MNLLTIDKINSATKYPSIPTFHALGDRGGLTEGPTAFHDVDEDVVWTEKVDGTNSRIILLPGGDYVIGSREELLYAKGDRVENPALGIVDALKPLADRATALGTIDGTIGTLYLEVYGGKVGGQAKQYTSLQQFGYRLFDYSAVSTEILGSTREQIAMWRENNGQIWSDEDGLRALSEAFDIPLVPHLGSIKAGALPTTVEDMHGWLTEVLPRTHVALDESAGGTPEGVVLRTKDRRVIAKARFQDYERTLKRRTQNSPKK